MQKLAEITQLELRKLESDANYDLSPLTRLHIYDAIGPTRRSSSYSERYDRAIQGKLKLTRADRVRAQLAILSAHKVIPLWEGELLSMDWCKRDTQEQAAREALEQLALLHAPKSWHERLCSVSYKPECPLETLAGDARSFAQELSNGTLRALFMENADWLQLVNDAPAGGQVRFALSFRNCEFRSPFTVPSSEIPNYLLTLAEGLIDGTFDPTAIGALSCDIHALLGNCLGFDEEYIPAQMLDVCEAADEAVNQALGLGPFNSLEIGADTTDDELMGKGAASAAGVKAWSGIYQDGLSTRFFDASRRREFWRWWLSDAIPQAIGREPERSDDLDVMPFNQTVEATRFVAGSITESSSETDGQSKSFTLERGGRAFTFKLHDQPKKLS